MTGDMIEDDLPHRTLWMPMPPLTAHPLDWSAMEFHPAGTNRMAHSHLIRESWSIERKTSLGSHIDRAHSSTGLDT